MSDNISCMAIRSTIRSMLGNGKSSLGQTLLISLKFVHILMWPSGFAQVQNLKPILDNILV